MGELILIVIAYVLVVYIHGQEIEKLLDKSIDHELTIEIPKILKFRSRLKIK